MANQSKKVLVTGAAGFLGSYLVEGLISRGYCVVGIDNFFRGKIENLNSVIKNEDFKFFFLDMQHVNAAAELNSILITEKIEVIYHLAAINGTEYFYDSSLMVLDTNIRITQTLIEAIKYTEVSYLAYTSSSEVYGDPLSVPTVESHPILLNAEARRDSYASSKAIGDFYVKLASDQLNIKSVIFRVFNMYAPRMIGTKYGQVIGEFVTRVINDSQFTIIGDGSHSRSFCYAPDAIRAMIDLFEIDYEGTVNIGNDKEISILYLAELIHKKVGRKFSPIFLPERPNDHKRRCPDISLLKKNLPNLRFTSLDDGLDITIESFKNKAKEKNV